MHTVPLVHRATKRTGGAQGKYKEWGPTKWIVWEGSGGSHPENFEILHALKCVLEAPEALFHACTQYIYTYKLPLSKGWVTPRAEWLPSHWSLRVEWLPTKHLDAVHCMSFSWTAGLSTVSCKVYSYLYSGTAILAKTIKCLSYSLVTTWRRYLLYPGEVTKGEKENPWQVYTNQLSGFPQV